jgi:hypothetical protein
VPGLTRLFRHGRGDRGAVTSLVAVLLAGGVLLGMSAYAIDLGTLYAFRDQAINAANAAAMAAAQTCVRPGATCGQDDPTSYAAANIPGGGVVLNSSTGSFPICGQELGRGRLDPCAKRPAGPTQCIGSRDNSTSWVEVHATTRMGDGSTVFPPSFAGSFVPGYRPDGIGACARVAWGPPAGPYAVLAMSLCAFRILTNDLDPNYFRAPYEAPQKSDEVAIALEPQFTNPPDVCSDLVYLDSPRGDCLVDMNPKDEPFGSTNNPTDTAPLPPGCRNLLDRKEVPPNPNDPQPYLLMVVYDPFKITLVDGRPQFNELISIGAFQPTGDSLSTDRSPKASWLTGETACAHGGEHRCLRGYFISTNIIDGRFPARGWDHTLGIATFKTVG